jgi:hypothetical protein
VEKTSTWTNNKNKAAFVIGMILPGGEEVLSVPVLELEASGVRRGNQSCKEPATLGRVSKFSEN